jgi:hypothetical protein
MRYSLLAISASIIATLVTVHPAQSQPDAACAFAPAGPVTISVGNSQLFGGNADCTGNRTVSLSPTSGSFGFNSTCTQFAKSLSGALQNFRVYACSEGSATVSFSDISQTIAVGTSA